VPNGLETSTNFAELFLIRSTLQMLSMTILNL